MSNTSFFQPKDFFIHSHALARPNERKMNMPSYKDEKTGTWYCKFYYVNWQGKKKQKLKRGFPRQKDAKEYERKFLEQFAKNPDITFEALYLKYKEYIRLRIRESTAASRFSTIERHINEI